jgi:Tfp pilus assembly protein PilX
MSSSATRDPLLPSPATAGRAPGFSLVEFLIGLVVLVISSAALLNHLAINYQTTASERDRVFAFSKAQAILAEIQNRVDRGVIDTVEIDSLDNGTTNEPTLSIQTDEDGELVPPDHVVSGNFLREGQWLWSRRITVQPFGTGESRNVRYVTVRVYRRTTNGEERAQADLSAVVNSAGDSDPTTQALDLYLLAVENVPSWWLYADAMRPTVESIVLDVQARNPGLEFRTHWITKSSFGRNPGYLPAFNDAVDSNQTPAGVYSYPGLMPAGSASTYYYAPDSVEARILVDGVETNGYDVATNPYPYALADQWNHAMRAPAERAAWTSRVAAIQAREDEIAQALRNGDVPPEPLPDMSKEPTLRLFLDDLVGDPTKHQNALVLNLHGELMPMPPLRNFSDPAKSPVAYPDLRVVTHPEELRTRRNESGSTDALRFRMYAWPHETSGASYAGSPVMADPMVVEFVGVNLIDSSSPTRLASFCTLQNVPGGVTVSGSANYATAWQTAKHVSASPAVNEMHYSAEWVPPAGGEAGFTRVYLFNTPVGALPVTQSGLQYGLPATTESARLYQMEYIPCPLTLPGSGMPTFTPDLTSAGAVPKNTARWILQVGTSALTSSRFVTTTGSTYNPTSDVVLEVRTRIATGYGAGATTWQQGGLVWPTPTVLDPDNLSVTYAWWADSALDVPMSERAQFQGDPRHLPYRDCFRNGVDFPNAYNWCFDNLTSGSGGTAENAQTLYPSIEAAVLRDGWAGGAIGVDATRFLQVLREGLTKSRCVFATGRGQSFRYLGLGGEVGYTSANGYNSSIPVDLTPYGSPGSDGNVDTVTSSTRFVRAPGASGTSYWFGMPWLGELYPDSVAATQWLDSTGGFPRGNLTPGTAANQFYQQAANTAYTGSLRQAFGTSIVNTTRNMALYGGTTFFNIGTAASTFAHSSSNQSGSISGTGPEVAANYGVTCPTSAPASNPWRITNAATLGEHWTYAPYTTRHSASLFEAYYTHGAGTASGAIKLTNSGSSEAAYVVVNALDRTVTGGDTFLNQWSLLSLVHTRHEAGPTNNSLRIMQLPRVEIEEPTAVSELDDPSTIDIEWDQEWRRWDGRAYATVGSFNESTSELRYVLKYSRDGGTTWRHVLDESTATPGVKSAATYLLAGNASSYAWDVSGDFPEGTYILRLECFRNTDALHYAYHQTRLFIQR